MKADPLPSWRDTETKKTILSYVKSVTDPGSADFIPEKDRIAVSDFDGTLVGENGGIGVPGWIEIELIRYVLSERFPSSAHAQELLRTYDRLAGKLASDPEPIKTETAAYWDAYFRVEGFALKGLTVEEACGLIGAKTVPLLRDLGINTIGDLARYEDISRLRQVFGKNTEMVQNGRKILSRICKKSQNPKPETLI